MRLAQVLGFVAILLLAQSVGAAAQGETTRDDPFTPARNAVVSVGGCTGTLIDDQIVLTAAHCLPKDVRAERPLDVNPITCRGLSEQGALQGRVWEDPLKWYPAGSGLEVRAGNTRKRIHTARKVTEYALPRCADLALLRIDLAFPRYVAVALPILTTPPEDTDRFLTLTPLRHAGWGARILADPHEQRQTGTARYWGHTRCHLIALPPKRDSDIRVLKGDSGSPLILSLDDIDVVIGVLWGFGPIDRDTCGTAVPPAPRFHGSYTPTWRRALPKTPATDIGAWLMEMAPGAARVAPTN